MRALPVCLALGLLSSAPAQVINNWTNQSSARWDSSTNWSLATPPASNQSVNITNDGYKAVNIDSSTVSGYPASLTISNLQVSAPTNGLSTLLLNYSGLETPLKVLNDCTVGINGTIMNSFGSFELDGSAGGALTLRGLNFLTQRGTFSQEGGSTVIHAPVRLLGGQLNATNASMTLGPLVLGLIYQPQGYVYQQGGSIVADNITITRGTYNLLGGVVYAIGGTVVQTVLDGGLLDGEFYQTGGTNYSDVSMNGTNGDYVMYDGMCQGTSLSVSAGAFYRIIGGLLDMQNISVSGGGTPGNPPGPNLSIGGGLTRCGTLTFGENGMVSQTRGEFFVTNDLSFGGSGTDFQLRGGILHVPSLTMGPSSSFEQLGGTNDIVGTLSLSNSTYWLYGGSLQPASMDVGLGAALILEGGTNTVSDVLSLTGVYHIDAGILAVGGLYLRGTLFLNGGFYTNYGLMDLGGTINTRIPEMAGGQVRLSANAVISFIGDFGSSQHVRFSPGAAIAWTSGAVLTISNWDNTTNGTDHTRLYFGTDSSGLTASQLRQITFSNPGGFAPGNYPAQLLSTGELVPVLAPTLQWARSGSALVLTWPGGYQLLSATNITGPYLPVSGASSPWTNILSKPQEFFRVQSP